MTTTDSRHHNGWFDHLINCFAIIAGVCMCALTILVCFDVAVRNFHLFAMPWSLEVAEYSLLLITFLGAPWVLETGGHISIDIVVDRLDADKEKLLSVVLAAHEICRAAKIRVMVRRRSCHFLLSSASWPSTRVLIFGNTSSATCLTTIASEVGIRR